MALCSQVGSMLIPSHVQGYCCSRTLPERAQQRFKVSPKVLLNALTVSTQDVIQISPEKNKTKFCLNRRGSV